MVVSLSHCGVVIGQMVGVLSLCACVLALWWGRQVDIHVMVIVLLSCDNPVLVSKETTMTNDNQCCYLSSGCHGCCQ